MHDKNTLNSLHWICHKTSKLYYKFDVLWPWDSSEKIKCKNEWFLSCILVILLYTNCVLGLTESDDGHKCDRNMLQNNM